MDTPKQELQAVQKGLLIDFVPLPSDPNEITDEQLDALFPPGKGREFFLRELARLAYTALPEETDEETISTMSR